jgi:RHS repeat-associated protein
MRHLIIFLVLITCPLMVLAGNGNWEKRINLLNLQTGLIYGIQEPLRANQDVKAVDKLAGYLFLDYTRKEQSDLDPLTHANFWRLKVVYYVGSDNQTLYTLQISYENGVSIFSDYNNVAISNTGYEITVKSISGEYSANGSTWFQELSPASSQQIPNDIDLRLELRCETVYNMEPNVVADQSRLNFNSSTYRVNWSFVEGAEWYDLEWVFIDKYSKEYADLTTLFANPANLANDLDMAFDKKASTRVRVWGTNYTLDKVYPEGTLYFRVRSVSNFTANGSSIDQVKLGSWNYFYNPANYGGSIDANDFVRYEIGTAQEFEPNKNWLYGVAFAEAGKNVSSVTFYDGSNRGRQNISYNTSDNISLVGETKFDREGRQTVSVIPAPVAGRQLGYRVNFNLTSAGNAFDEDEFDLANSLDTVRRLSSQTSGAANYFSSNNSFSSDLYRAAIPDAYGFVFSQTIYRNDGSGRIERVGGIGEEFKASGDHAIRTFYGSPTEVELKRLFGNNVSDDPTGYRKEMVRDANGQYSVTYYDKRGHVIATGLSGESPSSLRKIEQGNPELFTTDLSDNNIVINGNQLVSEHTFLNGVENNSITLNYSLTGLVTILSSQNISVGNQTISIGELCTTCHYDLTIQVLKADGTSASSNLPINIAIDPVGCAAGTVTPTIPTIVLPTIGEYRIIKTLTVDQQAMEDAFENLLESQGINNSQTFVNNYIDQVDLTGCFDNCDDYCTALWKLDYMQVNNATAAQANYQWNSVLTATQRENYLVTCKADVCDLNEVNDGFTNPNDPEVTACSAYRDIAIDQISPGGILYQTPNSSFWLAVAANIGSIVIGGHNYTLAELHDESIYTREIAEWFLDNGNYHRETCHLNLCQVTTNSTNYGIGLTSLLQTTAWNPTSTVFTQPYDNDVFGWTSDPFLSHSMNTGSLLQNAVANYMTYQYSISSTWGGTWGCPGSTWPTTGSLVDYVEYYVDCMVLQNPSMTAAEIEQMHKALFIGAYHQIKERLIANYKATIGCNYFSDEYAIFHAPPSETDMQSQLAVSLSNMLNPPNCDGKAWDQVNLWMNQLPTQCLVDLGLMQLNATTGLYEPTYTQTGVAAAYAASTESTLADFFYAYSMELCSTNTWGWFYDPDTGVGTQVGETEFDQIVTILSASPCSISSPYLFQVTPAPVPITTPIANQQFSDCFMDFVALINQGFTQYNINPSVSISVTSTSHPNMFSDCAVTSPSGNLVPGTFHITSNGTNYYIDYNSALSGCRTTVALLDREPFNTPFSPSNTIVLLTNPVKEQVTVGPTTYYIITFDAYLSNGTMQKVYIDTKLLNCIQIGSFGDQVITDLGGFEIDLTVFINNYQIDCIAAETGQATIDAQTLYNDMLAGLHNDFLAAASECLNVTETFTMSYYLKEYQYTLYYYDLAGNLVQTVPPQGVRVLDADDITAGINPPHNMETRYQYNGLNSLIASYTPDGDASVLYLDKLYRVRFSQNAQQAADGKASYSKYDDLGRVTEAGEIELATNTPAYLQSMVEVTGFPDVAIPAHNVLDYTRTYYESGYPTDATIATQFGTNGQENLRNAIGAVMHRQGDYTAAGTLIAGTEVITVSSYSYDPHKNVKQVVNTNYMLQKIAQQHKTVQYAYDLISGNVQEVVYQSGKADEYRHRYHYDANNRLIRSFTSNNNVIWEMDAKYFYYLHGALARTETGHDKVQGTDYAYTLQGWLKGVNSATLNASRDLGKDGDATGLNKWSGVDAMGYQLGYYGYQGTSQGQNVSRYDYNSIGTVTAFANTDGFTANNTNTDAAGASMKSLFNGNITHMVTAIRDIIEAPLDVLGNNYQYDQLQRIREMKVYNDPNLLTSNTFNTAGPYRELNGESAYQESYTFDKNGNLKTLKRNGSGLTSYGSLFYTPSGGSPYRVPLEMDNFTYNYYNDLSNTMATTVTDPINTNRLARVADAVVDDNIVTSPAIEGSQYGGDISNGNNDYTYNSIGQLIADNREDIQSIEWTVTGKVKKINFVATTNKQNVKFIYDPMDMRVAKIVYSAGNENPYIDYTYYSYDASGNVMATYNRRIEKTSQNGAVRLYSDKYRVEEQMIYGSSRIGTEITSITTLIVSATITQQVAQTEGIELAAGYVWSSITPFAFDNSNRRVNDKYYELSNHLGNVLAVVSDRKLELGSTNVYTADVVSFSDYSPYGTLLDGRHGQQNGTDYRYGFQGQENDKEVKDGDGLSWNYKYRMHDPRIGRFFAVDPLAHQYSYNSPYAFSENMVIAWGELEGLENYYRADGSYIGQVKNGSSFENNQSRVLTSEEAEKHVNNALYKQNNGLVNKYAHNYQFDSEQALANSIPYSSERDARNQTLKNDSFKTGNVAKTKQEITQERSERIEKSVSRMKAHADLKPFREAVSQDIPLPDENIVPEIPGDISFGVTLATALPGAAADLTIMSGTAPMALKTISTTAGSLGGAWGFVDNGLQTVNDLYQGDYERAALNGSQTALYATGTALLFTPAAPAGAALLLIATISDVIQSFAEADGEEF